MLLCIIQFIKRGLWSCSVVSHPTFVTDVIGDIAQGARYASEFLDFFCSVQQY